MNTYVQTNERIRRRCGPKCMQYCIAMLFELHGSRITDRRLLYPHTYSHRCRLCPTARLMDSLVSGGCGWFVSNALRSSARIIDTAHICLCNPVRISCHRNDSVLCSALNKICVCVCDMSMLNAKIKWIPFIVLPHSFYDTIVIDCVPENTATYRMCCVHISATLFVMCGIMVTTRRPRRFIVRCVPVSLCFCACLINPAYLSANMYGWRTNVIVIIWRYADVASTSSSSS